VSETPSASEGQAEPASTRARHLLRPATEARLALPAEESMAPDRTVIHVPSPDGRSLIDSDGTDGLLEGAVSASLELSALAAHLAEQRNQATERLSEIVETGQRVVHDLRKPLAVMKNALFLLARGTLARGTQSSAGTEKEDPATQALQMAREVTDHMEGLLGSFGDELKTREALSVGDELIDMAELSNDVARRLSLFARERGVELVVDGGLPTVVGRREGLTSVLANLVSNAIQYHDPDKSDRVVHVSWRKVRRGCLISVCDNGVGIPAGEGDSVFAKYERGSNSGDVGGTGLGLYMAREIVRAHGGRLGVRSVEGRGSLFHLVIPKQRLARQKQVVASNQPTSR